MKIFETLTDQQIIDLFSENVVGIFNGMITEDDPFYTHLHNLCLGYYTQHSAEKTISPVFEKYINLSKTQPIPINPETLMATLIRGKFIDKWTRIYTVLLSEYDALQNRKYSEKKTGKNKDTETYDIDNTKTANNSDVLTLDTNTEDNGKVGTKETVTRSSTRSDDVYGFNSVSPVGDTVMNGNESETTEGKAEDNTTYNNQKRTGTESREFGIDESVKKVGTQTNDYDIDESVERSGREGSNAELISEEIMLRKTEIFYDIVYKDIDSIATLAIYI